MREPSSHDPSGHRYPVPYASEASGIPPTQLAPSGTVYLSARTHLKDLVHEWLDILYRGKWLILATFVLVTAGVTAYTLQLSSEFQAYSLVSVNSNQSTELDAVLAASGGGSGMWSYGNQRVLENELIVFEQSLILAERVADRLMLMGTLPEAEQPIAILRREDGVLVGKETVVARLQEAVDADVEANNVDFIRITGVSTHPVEAALLANLYAEEFQQLTRERSRQRLAASRTFLEELVAKQDSALTVYEDQVATFLSEQGAIPEERGVQQTARLLDELDVTLAELEVELQLKESYLASLEEEIERLQPHLISRLTSGTEQEIGLVQEEIARLEVQRREVYLANPGALRDHPQTQETLRDLNGKLRFYKASLDSLSRVYVDEVMAAGVGSVGEEGVQRIYELRTTAANERVALQGLDAKREILLQQREKYDTTIRNMPGQAQVLTRLERQKASTESIYLFVLQKLQETRIAEESELGYSEIVREATIPTMAFRPNKRRNVMLGGFLGLFLGGILAIARVKLDFRIHRPEDLKQKGYSVLGIVPKMNKMLKEEFGNQRTVEIDNHEIGTELVALLSPLSPVVEAYRQIRTNIQFSRPDTVVQTLVITSATASEGKTTTAANLAVVMAQSGRRTLVIDADLRRPRMHKVFGVKREPGLVEVLFGKTAIDDERFATGIDDLFLIPAGSAVPNASELLGSQKMRDLIRELRSHFDMIIFDTPPVLVGIDSVLLATQCEGTLLVTAAGKAQEHELERSHEQLGAVGAPVIGHTLNGFDASMAYGYMYKYKYYRYGYGNKYKDYYQPTAD